MKKYDVLFLLFTLVLMGAGCQSSQMQEPVANVLPAVEELQVQTVPEIVKEDKNEAIKKSEPAQADTAYFRGRYFTVAYPENFEFWPTAPTTVFNGKTFVQTDEAFFISPDETVDFFVYSPLWSGDPESYFEIALSEQLVSEKIEETKEEEHPGQFGDKIVRWVTIKAKDDSYYRSFVSIKSQVGTGSDLHHVFGIKYQDNAAYEKYKAAYVAFKESLKQYSD